MESIFKLGILLTAIDRVSGPVGRIMGGMNNLKGSVNSLGPAFDKFKTYGLLLTTISAGLLHVMSGAAMATAPAEKALGELASVGVKHLAAVEAAGADFSNKWSGTTKDQFISAAYDIKSGIASLTDEGVAEFTKLAALTGKATKSTTAEMTSLFATGYGIYKDMYADLSDMQFGEVFSAGIAASVKNFKTTGSGMAQAISTLGATATTAKVPLQEQLSILGMLQATMTGSEAGTKYKAMMQAAAGAGEKLNLKFLDANNQLLSMPDILMTLRKKYGSTLDAMEKMEIQKAFGTQEAVAVIDLLYDKVGDLKNNISSLGTAMNQGASFAEQMAMAMNMDIGAGGELLAQQWSNLVTVAGKQLIPVLIPLFTWIGNILVALQGFAAEHETAVRILVLFAAGLGAVVFVMGSLATVFGAAGLMWPGIVSGFGLATRAAGMFKSGLLSAVAATKSWIMWQRQSFLTTLYMEGGLLSYAKTLATAPVRALKNAAVATWGHITSLFGQLAASVAAAGGLRGYALAMGGRLLTAVGAATKATWAFTTSLLANPITWVVLGIAALVAGLVILEKEFGLVSRAWDMFMYGLGYVVGVCEAAGEAMVDAFMVPFRWIGNLIDRVGGVREALKMLVLSIALNWDAVKVGATQAIAWIKGLIPEFLESGKALWGAFTSGIQSLANQPVEAVKSSLTKLRNLLPFSDAKEGPLSTLTLSGARLIETFGAGVESAGPGLIKTMAGAMAGVMVAMTPVSLPQPDMPLQRQLSRIAGGLQNAQAVPAPIAHISKAVQTVPAMSMPVAQTPRAAQTGAAVPKPGQPAGDKIVKKTSVTSLIKESRSQTHNETHLHIANITLPNVSHAGGFMSEMRKLAEGYNV